MEKDEKDEKSWISYDHLDIFLEWNMCFFPVSCTLHEPFRSIRCICARTSNAPQASDTYWFGDLDSVHEAATFWRFP